MTDPLDTLRALEAALDETTRMLEYLWSAEGLVEGVRVQDWFHDSDPLTEDVSRVIAAAQAALAASTAKATLP